MSNKNIIGVQSTLRLFRLERGGEVTKKSKIAEKLKSPNGLKWPKVAPVAQNSTRIISSGTAICGVVVT